MSLLNAESVNHVSIPVNDLERAKKFYTEMLGMRELPRDPSPGPRPPTVDQVMDLGPTPLVRLECGGLEVTLFQRPKPLELDPVRINGGFHYSFRMNWDELSRLASNIEELRKAGYHIPCEPIWRFRGTEHENISVYVLDTEGNLFEMVSKIPGAAYRTPGSQPVSQ
ncbi:MAG TPA: VOC family protein [Dehalococcoidia bacterium]|nr:VOC family protein [Dehalococcoidia bacterium]